MNPSKLQDNVVLLDLTMHRPGDTRRESAEKVQTGANKRWLKLSKRIFDSDNYRRACRVQDELKGSIKSVRLPARLHGCYAIPVGLVPAVLDKINAAKAELSLAAEAFAAERESIETAASGELADLFQAGQIPTASQIRRRFQIEDSLVELSVPGEAKIGNAFAAAERSKARNAWEDASNDVTLALREELRGLVAHLAEQLEPAADGKRKRLPERSLEKVTEWLDLFAKRNVLGDDDLQQLAERAKLLLNGRDAGTLRENDRLREKVGAEFGRVRVALDGLIEDMPARRITFEEDVDGQV